MLPLTYIKCWLWALLKIRLFFTSLNDKLCLWIQDLTLSSASHSSFKNSYIKGSFLKKYWISLKFNRLYESDHVRNAMRSLSDYCSLYTFSYKWPNTSQMDFGWMQRISCTTEMESPVNMLHAQLESHITVIFLIAFLC